MVMQHDATIKEFTGSSEYTYPDGRVAVRHYKDGKLTAETFEKPNGARERIVYDADEKPAHKEITVKTTDPDGDVVTALRKEDMKGRLLASQRSFVNPAGDKILLQDNVHEGPYQKLQNSNKLGEVIYELNSHHDLQVTYKADGRTVLKSDEKTFNADGTTGHRIIDAEYGQKEIYTTNAKGQRVGAEFYQDKNQRNERTRDEQGKLRGEQKHTFFDADGSILNTRIEDVRADGTMNSKTFVNDVMVENAELDASGMTVAVQSFYPDGSRRYTADAKSAIDYNEDGSVARIVNKEADYHRNAEISGDLYHVKKMDGYKQKVLDIADKVGMSSFLANAMELTGFNWKNLQGPELGNKQVAAVAKKNGMNL